MEGVVPIGKAAAMLGVSVDTIRRWEREGKLTAGRDGRNRRVIAESELRRLGVRPAVTTGTARSARNRFEGVVSGVEISGVVGLVEISAGPFRVASVITRDAIEELGLRPGVEVAATVKATEVMVERL